MTRWAFEPDGHAVVMTSRIQNNLGRRTLAPLLAAAALSCAPACVDQAFLLPGTPEPDGAVDAGQADPAPLASVFDPDAEHVIPEPTVVFDPAQGEGVMQGGDVQVVWTGRRYVLVWRQNRSGRVHLVSRTIDPDSPNDLGPIQRLAPDDQASDVFLSSNFTALSQQGRVAVLWAVRDAELHITWLDLDGVPIDRRTLLERARVPATLLPWPDGYLLLLGAAGSLRAVELSRNGMGTADHVLFPARRGRVARNERGSVDVLWADRTAGGPDSVFRARFDGDFNPIGEPEEIYTGEHAVALFLGPSEGPRYGVIQDFDAGTWWWDLEGIEAPLEIGPPGLNGLFGVHDPTAPRVLLVHEIGEYRGTNPLPTGVAVQAVDYAARSIGPKSVVMDDGGCLEDVDLAVAGRSIGIAWTIGCSTRVLRFVEIRAR